MSNVDHANALPILLEFDKLAKEYLDACFQRDCDDDRVSKEFHAAAAVLLKQKWSIPAVIESIKKSSSGYFVKVQSKLEIPNAKCFWNTFGVMKISEKYVPNKKGSNVIYVQGKPMLYKTLVGKDDKKYESAVKKGNNFEVIISRLKGSRSIIQHFMLCDISLIQRL